MHYEGDDYVSLLDFIEHLCDNNKDIETISAIANDFCILLTSKYSFEGNKCFKAEALDKTRHILMPIGLVLKIFVCENIKKKIIRESFESQFNFILSKNYIINGPSCCCCPKKLRKAVTHLVSFNEFVRQGQSEVRRFQSLKPKIDFLISLDIEGNELSLIIIVKLLIIYTAFEHSVDKLLEFGLSIYELSTNTTTITHIIVTDHIHLKNGRFVADNRDKFNFGNSRFLPLKPALDYVFAVLATPNSCLIGHNIMADIKFLKSVSSKKLIMPFFDTQIIYKQAVLSEQILGLMRVLEAMEIPYSNLHNAGNDAYYTLEVFKKLAEI